jgi:hypothetical protein
MESSLILGHGFWFSAFASELREFASDAKQTNTDLWPSSGFPEASEHLQKSDCAAGFFAFFFVARPTCDEEPGARDALWIGRFWEKPRV